MPHWDRIPRYTSARRRRFAFLLWPSPMPPTCRLCRRPAQGRRIFLLHSCDSSPNPNSCGEELVDETSSVIGALFREEVATFHRLPLCARSPLTPNAQRTAVFCIESVERTTFGP